MDKLHGTIVLKWLDIRQWRVVIFEGWGPYGCFSLPRESFWATVPGWQDLAERDRLPELRSWSWDVERPRGQGFTGQHTLGQSSPERKHPRSTQRSPEYLGENQSTHFCEGKTGGWEKNQPKGPARKCVMLTHTGLEQCPLPSDRQKPHPFQGSGRDNLPQQWEKPWMETARSCLQSPKGMTWNNWTVLSDLVASRDKAQCTGIYKGTKTSNLQQVKIYTLHTQ